MHRLPRLRVPGRRHPDLVQADWWPQYPDYLYLAFTNSTSPQPHRHPARRRWAKMVMLVQSSISLVIAIMIVARAVNILT